MKFDGVSQTFSNQAVLDGLNVGVLALNPQMEIVFMNRLARQIFGEQHLFPVGTKCYRILPISPRNTPCVNCPARQTFADSSTHAKIQPRQACKNTRFLRVTSSPLTNAAGEVEVVLLLVEDFSEHLKITEELRQSRDFYLKLFNEFPNPIWRAGKDAKCDYFNHAWLEFTGRTMAQELGDGWTEGIHPSDFDNCVKSFMEAFRQRRPFILEYRLRHHSGEYRHIHDYGRPFYDNSGQFLGYIGSCYDIQNAKEAEAALVRSGQFSAVGVLAAGIAHEYNNLLTPVLGFANMLLSQGNLPADARQKLGYIKMSAERAAEIASKLLSFARPSQPTQNTCDAAQTVRDMLDLVKAQFRSDKIEIHLVDNPAPHAVIDRLLLGQVLMNLLINAGHAMVASPKKILTVETGERDQQVFIKVSDTGCCIPQADLPKIFLPFFSAKGEHAKPGSPLSNVKGVGLGLSVCNAIVLKHGGRIDVESLPDKGTTFTVILPVANNWEPPTITKANPADLQSLRGLRVLVADESSTARAMAQEVLQTLGCETVVADSGASAVSLVRRFPFDVLLLDNLIAKNNGDSLLIEIDNIKSAPTVVLMNSEGECTNLESDNRIRGVVSKPFDDRALYRVLSETLA